MCTTVLSHGRDLTTTASHSYILLSAVATGNSGDRKQWRRVSHAEGTWVAVEQAFRQDSRSFFCVATKFAVYRLVPLYPEMSKMDKVYPSPLICYSVVTISEHLFKVYTLVAPENEPSYERGDPSRAQVEDQHELQGRSGDSSSIKIRRKGQPYRIPERLPRTKLKPHLTYETSHGL